MTEILIAQGHPNAIQQLANQHVTGFKTSVVPRDGALFRLEGRREGQDSWSVSCVNVPARAAGSAAGQGENLVADFTAPVTARSTTNLTNDEIQEYAAGFVNMAKPPVPTA